MHHVLCFCVALLLVACKSPPLLYPRVLHLTPEAARVYDTLLLTGHEIGISTPQ